MPIVESPDAVKMNMYQVCYNLDGVDTFFQVDARSMRQAITRALTTIYLQHEQTKPAAGIEGFCIVCVK